MTRARRGHLMTVVVFGTIALGWLALWLGASGALPQTGETYTVRAKVTDAGALGNGANVTIAGLGVGKVESISQDSAGALLELDIDPEHAPLPADTRYGVRLRTVVGENYVEVYPGASQEMIPDGGILLPSLQNAYVDVNQILDTLRGDTRDRARQMFQGLGGGVDGRGQDLNQLLGGASGLIDGAGRVSRVIAGERESLARLVDELGTVTREVGDRGASIRSLAATFRTTVESVASRDDALRATLERFPTTLRQVRSTTGILRDVTGSAAPVLSALGGAVMDLKPAIANLSPAASEGQRVLSGLSAAAPPLTRTLGLAQELAEPAPKALAEVRNLLCEVNPALEYLAPYDQELRGILQELGYSTNFYDANGHAARLYASIGENTVKALDAQSSAAVDTLLSSGLLQMTHKLNYNAFPDPGDAGERATGEGPVGPYDVTEEYPRIQPEC